MTIRPDKVRLYKPQEQDRSEAGSGATRPKWDPIYIVAAFVLHERRLNGDMYRNRDWANRYPIKSFMDDLQYSFPKLLELREAQRGETLTWIGIARNLRNRIYKMFWAEGEGAVYASKEIIFTRFKRQHEELIRVAHKMLGLKVHND